MISENAKDAFNRIFERAARAHLAMTPADTIEIGATTAVELVAAVAPKVVVLTVASYRFRLLTLFHLGSDPGTVDYFTRGEREREFPEAFGEQGNLCCGAMNRELGRHFPHTGMSTPYLLDRHCLDFIEVLKPSGVVHHRITINGAIRFHASLCLCAYAPVDFNVGAEEVCEASGELELF